MTVAMTGASGPIGGNPVRTVTRIDHGPQTGQLE
jgi:hypothetical protein